MKILAIETSCDETSVAVLNYGQDGSFDLLSNIVSSQVKIHAPFGGVVPSLAKREHQKNLAPILEQSLNEAKLLQKIQNQKSRIQNKSKILEEILDREPELLKQIVPFFEKYQKPDIDYIAATNGPGLEPALWVGVNLARALAYFWDLPVIPVNHIEGHIIANWLPIANSKSQIANRSDDARFTTRNKLFPAVCLVVSGGHTQLVLMKDFGQYEILGETRDDAAGEAFDKLAKMLKLGYPGGPIVSEMAKNVSPAERQKIKLPRPMLNSKDYDFSFSGLKTAALYYIKTLPEEKIKETASAICAEFQQAVVDVLVSKTIRAAQDFSAQSILLAGGVAANDLLRNTLSAAAKELALPFSSPPKEFCGDNAAMIALAASLKKEKISWEELTVNANSRI
ncbi:MAG: tRNA (adenosine(37)-N6)-threonylcarbamoyltransferase complex transferase subunit TsaD [Candidatus Portnoybacteria bacterium]|nr:tRNA (adenosine(37)-N6)-threonylcarbamoyltransferase complex transferase subunit TsaD [Candidatus Portnoybacteria bacterium]